MKIIDLLNKIAKGEEVPKMITSSDIEECEDMIFIYDKDIQDYKTKDDDYFFEIAFNKSYPVINLEVKIIEEEKEIKFELEELKEVEEYINYLTENQNTIRLAKRINTLIRNQKKLIDAVNEIRKEK